MPIRKPLGPYYATICLLLCVFYRTDAAAEQFSVVCRPHGVSEYLTFDDQTKRVIGYGINGEGKIADAMFKGRIRSISPDEIQFDLEHFPRIVSREGFPSAANSDSFSA